ANAAAVVVDQLAERHRDGRLDDTGLLHVSGHGVDPRAALALGAEPGEPLRTAVNDVRHGHDGLDVVDDGRVPERTLDGGGRRLDLGPALLAFEGREEARLLAADVGPGPAVAHHIGIRAPSLDVLSPEARPPGLAAPPVRP